MKQLQLLPKTKPEHGGSLNHNMRNAKRPLHSQKVIHLVLKANKGVSLYKSKGFILKTIIRQAELSGIKIYALSIQHDHIHHAICFANRTQYNRFVRSVTGLLSRKFGRSVWKYRPYTRVVEWGRGYKNLKAYIHQNELEVQGAIPYQARKWFREGEFHFP